MKKDNIEVEKYPTSYRIYLKKESALVKDFIKNTKFTVEKIELIEDLAYAVYLNKNV